MVNSGSPTLTDWPSLKCSFSMKPETRARISTTATASKRPEYSSHCVTRLATGAEIDTGIAGGPPCAKAEEAETQTTRPASRPRRRDTDTEEAPPTTSFAARSGDVVALQQSVNRQRSNRAT